MYVYKLTFKTPVRFGMDSFSYGLTDTAYTCHCDTLFSALCIQILRLQGKGKLEEFVNYANTNSYAMSDLFPFYFEDLFFKKPFLYVEGEKRSQSEEYLKRRKELKKLEYININEWDEYICNWQKGEFGSYDNPEIMTTIYSERVKVSANSDSEPYFLKGYSYYEDGGLYFILKCEDDNIKKIIDIAMDSLEDEGIGAERSSGYGKFSFVCEDANELLLNLLNRKSEKYMLLSILYPEENTDFEELIETSSYQIIKRTGFVYSDSYSENMLKKKEIHVFNSGSCFAEKQSGKIVDVSQNGGHKVFRYAKGLYMGVLP